MKSRISLPAAACCLLAASAASATLPDGITTGFERLESVSYSRVSTTVAGVEQSSSEWRAGLGTGGGYSYSMPRVSLEYVWESGLSIGGCVGVQWSWSKGKVSANADVVEPRVGYHFDLGNDFILWPRLGLTLRELKGPGVLEGRHTALTLDVPLLRLRDQVASFTLGPFLDLGLGGGKGDTDQTVTEFGLGLGLQFR